MPEWMIESDVFSSQSYHVKRKTEDFSNDRHNVLCRVESESVSCMV